MKAIKEPTCDEMLKAIPQIIHTAYDLGRQAGWAEAMKFVRELGFEMQDFYPSPNIDGP